MMMMMILVTDSFMICHLNGFLILSLLIEMDHLIPAGRPDLLGLINAKSIILEGQ